MDLLRVNGNCQIKHTINNIPTGKCNGYSCFQMEVWFTSGSVLHIPVITPAALNQKQMIQMLLSLGVHQQRHYTRRFPIEAGGMEVHTTRGGTGLGL